MTIWSNIFWSIIWFNRERDIRNFELVNDYYNILAGYDALMLWVGMAKFNVVQKRRRALIAEKKRQLHGDPLTGKLKIKDQPLSLSGKRKRKLFKKWRRVLSLSFSFLVFSSNLDPP